MKLRTALLIVAIIGVFDVSAQEKSQYIGLEAGGNAGYGSVIYVLEFPVKPNFHLQNRIGLGAYRFTDFDQHFNPSFVIPILFGASIGTTHRVVIETGTGFSSYPQLENNKSVRTAQFSWQSTVAYRFQQKRCWIQVGYVPMVEPDSGYRSWWGAQFAWKL